MGALLAEQVNLDSPRVLELGCRSGDLTMHLQFAARVDAVDPSAAIPATIEARDFARPPELNLIQAHAENALLSVPYDLVVAGESLHWMEWAILFPRLQHVLSPGGLLAIVGRQQAPMQNQPGVLKLISQYSTNRDFRPYDLIDELKVRRLFDEQWRERSQAVAFEQSIDEVIESLHLRNGLSPDRMAPEAAQEFDEALSIILKEAYPDARVPLTTWSSVVWGVPTGAEEPGSPTHRIS